MDMQGDDLDDDFVPDDLVALSGDELDDANDQFLSDAEDIAAMSADDDGAPAKEKDQATIDRKRKRREKAKERKAKRMKLAETQEASEPSSLAAQPPPVLAEYLLTMQAKSFSAMSAIELGDVQIPVASITDTTAWIGSRDLSQLPDFIIKVLPTLRTRLSQKSKANGAPTLLFLTGAALRVADVTRVLKDPRLRSERGGEVAKLFAKHFKLSEHVTYLKRTKVGSAVGTPGRIGKLLCETDALTISALTHIILDVTFRDAKKRTLLDIPETRDEVFKTVLGCDKVFEAIKEGKIQVVLF